MSLKLTDLLEGMSDEEFANAQAFDRLSKDDQDKLAAIRQMMSNEKEMEIIKKMAPKTDMKSLRKLSKMEEDLFSKDGGNEDNVDNIDKVASPSAKANDYSAAVSSNRSEDSAEQAGTTKTTKPMYNENKGMSLVDLAKKLGIDVDELEAKIMKFKGKEKDEIEAGARASMAEENDEEKMPMDEEGKGYKEYEDDVEKEKLAKAGDLKEEADPIEAEMKMHLKQYNAGNIDGDDLAKAFDEILNGRISPPGERGFNTRYGMEENGHVKDYADELKEDDDIEELAEGAYKDFIMQAKEAYSNSEVQSYIDSLNNDMRLNGSDQYDDYDVEDYLEDFRNYVDDKMDDVREHFSRFK